MSEKGSEETDRKADVGTAKNKLIGDEIPKIKKLRLVIAAIGDSYNELLPMMISDIKGFGKVLIVQEIAIGTEKCEDDNAQEYLLTASFLNEKGEVVINISFPYLVDSALVEPIAIRYVDSIEHKDVKKLVVAITDKLGEKKEALRD